jgi:hypothetical protein
VVDDRLFQLQAVREHLGCRLGNETRRLRFTFQLLRAAVEREGSQVTYARRHGLERSQLNQILAGKRPVSASVVKALGLQKVYTVKLRKP